jgi:hypothetical protein
VTQQDMQRVSERLADPSLTDAERGALYASLKAFGEQLRMRDTNRRRAVIVFSTGLKVTPTAIAQFCRRYSLADFCILYGLSRHEVLERTELDKAGVL